MKKRQTKRTNLLWLKSSNNSKMDINKCTRNGLHCRHYVNYTCIFLLCFCVYKNYHLQLYSVSVNYNVIHLILYCLLLKFSKVCQETQLLCFTLCDLVIINIYNLIFNNWYTNYMNITDFIPKTDSIY